jgi:hypothetical protein
MPFILPIRAWLVRIPKVVNRNVNIPGSTIALIQQFSIRYVLVELVYVSVRPESRSFKHCSD